jgi:hypothetical protein
MRRAVRAARREADLDGAIVVVCGAWHVPALDPAVRRLAMETTQPGMMEAERLEALVDDLAARLTALPEATFTRRPAAAAWSAAEVVAHMSEMMPYWAGAVVAAAQEPGRRIGRELDDPDRTGAIVGANDRPRAEALTRLRHAAHDAATAIRALDVAGWRARVAHYSRGAMEIGDAVRSLIVEHAEGHVHQALEAAGGAHAD